MSPENKGITHIREAHIRFVGSYAKLPPIKTKPVQVKNKTYEIGLVEGRPCLIDRGLIGVTAIVIPAEDEESVPAKKIILCPLKAFGHSRLGKTLARK